MKLYASLSESAHPNYEGICIGYSEINHEEDVIKFANRWKDSYGAEHLQIMQLCMTIFEKEYADWEGYFEKLEQWLEANDSMLENSKQPTN